MTAKHPNTCNTSHEQIAFMGAACPLCQQINYFRQALTQIEHMALELIRLQESVVFETLPHKLPNNFRFIDQPKKKGK